MEVYRRMLNGWVLFNLYASLNIISIINKEVEVDWESSTCQIDKKRQLESRNRRWMDNIKIILI